MDFHWKSMKAGQLPQRMENQSKRASCKLLPRQPRFTVNETL